jgi:DNA-binding response OmpR family regulator
MSRDLSSSQVDVPRGTGPQAPPRRTILVVEDDFFLRSAVVDVLCRHGFTVLEARDTNKASDFLRSETIDLLFTDIRLPGFMDGLALATLVRKARPELKIIIASGHSLTGIDPQVADECLGKPYQFDHMVAVINGLLLGDRAASKRRRRSPAGEKAAPMRGPVASLMTKPGAEIR